MTNGLICFMIFKLMEGGDGDIDFRCDICYQSAAQGPIVTPCGHLYCQSCSCTWLRPVHLCPVCDAHLDARAQLLPNRPTGVRVATVSAANFILQSLCQMFIGFGEGVLVGIVNLTANLLIQALDRRFPDLIEVAEERDTVDGEESENDNGLNEAAQVMDNVNGEGSGNDNGSNDAVEVMDNVNGEASITSNELLEEGEARDNNGDGSSLTVVHPIGGLLPLM